MLEGTLKTISFHPLAMGRDTSQQPRLLKTFLDTWEIKFRFKLLHSQEEAFAQLDFPEGEHYETCSPVWLPAFLSKAGIWYLWDLLPPSNLAVIVRPAPKLLGGWEEKGAGRHRQFRWMNLISLGNQNKKKSIKVKTLQFPSSITLWGQCLLLKYPLYKISGSIQHWVKPLLAVVCKWYGMEIWLFCKQELEMCSLWWSQGFTCCRLHFDDMGLKCHHLPFLFQQASTDLGFQRPPSA